jgi:hypothetical protein
MKKRHAWVFLTVLAISGTTWGAMVTTGSAGGIGMIGGQTVGVVHVPGTYGGNAGVHVSVLDMATNAVGTVITGNNTLCQEGSVLCGGNDQQAPPCHTGCWPYWPNWFWPWGNVVTSSNSTSTTTANGPGCSATAETSGMSVGPGSSSSSHSYAQSVNP